MPIHVGEVEALFRYPVKSMRGEAIEAAEVGWHGIEGDRRLGIRRLGDAGGFPWLQASRLPELLLYSPGPAGKGELPSHITTPDGKELDTFGDELARVIGGRHGSPVEMMHLDRGIFDEASISIISSATVREIGALSSQPPDARRFRPNIVLSSRASLPFEEDGWVGGVLSFGTGSDAPAVSITNWDVRCSIVSLDPDSARPNAAVLKAVVRERNNKVGVYGAVTRQGRITAGQPMYFEPSHA